MVIVCKKYPKSIITMDSAFYYYNLTDVIPQTTHIATTMHSYVIPDENITQYFIAEELLEIGMINVNVNDGIINVYDKEKLLNYIEIIILNDENMDENNISDIYNTLVSVLKRKRYLENFNTVKNNWLEIPIIDVIDSILNFIIELETIIV